MSVFELVDTAVRSLDWKREPYGLYEPIAYTLESGGKRVRPTLALIGAGLFTDKPEKAMPAALALEIFHNFTLLHDDVMDQAKMRRGRPTVHVRWDDNTAILSGDEMIIDAYKQLALLPADKLAQVLPLFNQMATEICEGQQYDMEFEKREHVEIDEYINMIRLKTSVLLGTALRIGALLGDADDKNQQLLYDFGVNLGLAFQIQDDILDVYGNPETFGKAIGGDILCNKKSYVLLQALLHADEEELRQLKGWLHREEYVPDEKIRAVTTLYNQINVRPLCEQTMQDYTQKALSLLDAVEAPEDKKQALRLLADKLQNRKD